MSNDRINDLPIVERARNAAKIVGKAGDRIGERDIAEAAAVLGELYEALALAAEVIGRPASFKGLRDEDCIKHSVSVSIGFVKTLQAALERARQ